MIKGKQNSPGNFRTHTDLQTYLNKAQKTGVRRNSDFEKESELTALANISANVSQNSFLSTNNYKRVIIQQGVPLTDSDLNEIGQTSEYQHSSLILDFIGSGPPTYGGKSTGYQCTGNSLTNDFLIGTGRLYIADSPNGGAAPFGVCLTCAGFNYSTQPPPSLGGVQTALPALVTPTGTRADTIWLEVYNQDVGPLDNTALYFDNPLTSSNTDISHRLKAFAIIRVWENSGIYSGLGSTAILSAPFYNSSHSYYPLANMARTASPIITAGMITDLRPRISHSF